MLYIGVTNNLMRRLAEHKAKVNSDSFTEKYQCDKLVYYEFGESFTDAIAREKQLKNWKRDWKNDLVLSMNPTWEDLAESIGVTQEYIAAVAAEYAAKLQGNGQIAGQGCGDERTS